MAGLSTRSQFVLTIMMMLILMFITPEFNRIMKATGGIALLTIIVTTTVDWLMNRGLEHQSDNIMLIMYICAVTNTFLLYGFGLIKL